MILIAVLFLIFIGVGIALYFTVFKKKYKKILTFNPKSYSIKYMFDYPEELPPFSCNKDDFKNFNKGDLKTLECKNAMYDIINITKTDVIKDNNNEITVFYKNNLNEFRIIKPTKEGYARTTNLANGKNWTSNELRIYAIEN